jgi:hypothetical protein
MVATVVVAVLLYHSYRPLPFDEALWKNARTNRNDDVLYSMADDLAKKLNTSKMTRGEVLKLIGPEDKILAHFHRYNLGKHRGGFVIVSVNRRLEIVYNSETDRVLEARLMSD